MLLELRHRLVAYSVMCARLRFLSGVGFYGRDKSALDGSLVSGRHTPVYGFKQAHSSLWSQVGTLQANCLFHTSANVPIYTHNVLPFCNAQALHAAVSKHPVKLYEKDQPAIKIV